jgi:hypothetical protein
VEAGIPELRTEVFGAHAVRFALGDALAQGSPSWRWILRRPRPGFSLGLAKRTGYAIVAVPGLTPWAVVRSGRRGAFPSDELEFVDPTIVLGGFLLPVIRPPRTGPVRPPFVD